MAAHSTARVAPRRLARRVFFRLTRRRLPILGEPRDGHDPTRAHRVCAPQLLGVLLQVRFGEQTLFPCELRFHDHREIVESRLPTEHLAYAIRLGDEAWRIACAPRSFDRLDRCA